MRLPRCVVIVLFELLDALISCTDVCTDRRFCPSPDVITEHKVAQTHTTEVRGVFYHTLWRELTF